MINRQIKMLKKLKKKNMPYRKIKILESFFDDEFKECVYVCGVKNEKLYDKNIVFRLFFDKEKHDSISHEAWDNRIFALNKKGIELVEQKTKEKREFIYGTLAKFYVDIAAIIIAILALAVSFFTLCRT